MTAVLAARMVVVGTGAVFRTQSARPSSVTETEVVVASVEVNSIIVTA